MTTIPKFPNEADKEYYISDGIRKKAIKRDYLLTGPVIEANQPRVNARKVAQERNNTPSCFGATFTRQGLDEFEQEYTNNINPRSTQASTSHHSPQASTTPDSTDTTNQHSPQASTSQNSSPTPIKKTCTLNKNKKRFTIFHLTVYLTCPNKPKIQKVDREAIDDFCDIEMEFLVNSNNYKNEEAVEDYKRYAEDRHRLASFDIFPGVRDFINEAMNAEEKDIVRVLWNSEIRLRTTGSTRTLMDIICYTLTDFTSNCKQPLSSTNNHERTPFVKYIVPMFKYFSRETQFLEFCWCEKGLETQDMAVMENNDFVISLCNKKYADGLGKNTMTSNEEFFVECSSGFEKEMVNHSLDDTLKLLVECSNSLLYTIKQNKNASIDSITKKCTFGVQVIKQTLTLTKMTLSKSGKWKLVEVRSACIPTSWQLRANWNLLFEMLATIYHELLEQRKLDAQIINEVCGLAKLPSNNEN
ncbi:hypothetical protein [Parasitella parasitica]|uniref:Uncharacterized protein n=1 Tax=Parasitella parasitica TaxID=35722 RepID=A0A0B7NLR1_9FUNG|nr:hypothetical protein [Parasitella parasitica]